MSINGRKIQIEFPEIAKSMSHNCSPNDVHNDEKKNEKS